MENWNNLNKFLTLEQKDITRKTQWTNNLIEACSKGDKLEVKKILKLGAHLNSHQDYLTPLIACVLNDKLELTNFILNNGASIGYKPKIGFVDALWVSLKNKKHDFLKLFVEKRCILSKEVETNTTPLIFSTKNTDLIAVEILLTHSNIKVNEKDSEGNTALHYNLSKTEPTQDDLRIGQLLIAAGADSNIQNLDGQTPESMAQDFATKSMLLNATLEKELPINSNTNDDQTITTPKNKKRPKI